MKIEGYPDLKKNGAAVLNINRSAHEAALRRIQAAKKAAGMEDTINVLRGQVSSLESKLESIVALIESSVGDKLRKDEESVTHIAHGLAMSDSNEANLPSLVCLSDSISMLDDACRVAKNVQNKLATGTEGVCA